MDPKRIGIAAYSFGVIISFSATPQEEVQAVAAISPPVARAPLEGLKSYYRPKLLVLGSEDDIIREQAFRDFCQSLPEPKEYEVIPGADHFWSGYEEQLGQRVALFFMNAFQEPKG